MFVLVNDLELFYLFSAGLLDWKTLPLRVLDTGLLFREQLLCFFVPLLQELDFISGDSALLLGPGQLGLHLMYLVLQLGFQMTLLLGELVLEGRDSALM